MYKEMKVFEGHSYGGFTFVCTCEGVAREMGYGNVTPSRLLYNKQHESEIEDGILVYQGIIEMTGERTSWFLTRDEADEAAKRLSGESAYYVDYATLDTTEIAPVQFPLNVVFSSDKAGRPYVRLHLHPEVSGRNGPGKIYFPDRSMVGADVGEADITGVKEFDKYGFLKGEMEKNEMPDIASFADWAWDNMEPNTIIRFINHPGRGKYLATEYGTYLKPCEDGFCPMYTSYDDKQYTEQQMSLADLYIGLAFDGETSKSMLDKFKMSKFVFTRFAGTNWIFDDKYYSDLVDEAIQSSVIQAARLEGTDVRILTCPYANVWRLASFSQEEINELVSIVAKVNTAADEAILSRLRKGKLRIL